MKSKISTLSLMLLILIIFNLVLGISPLTKVKKCDASLKETLDSNPFPSDYNDFKEGNFTGYEFSSYNLSVYLNEDSSSVVGNLTVDFYNNDPVNFTKIPFHIYPSGMEYESRQGYMEILNVTTLVEPKEQLYYEVHSGIQLMWVNLNSILQSSNRTSFIISFNTTLPDGGIDRANDYGWDHNHTRIIKFANAYPQPCVYDEYDGWNTDSYLSTGDPFYFDMAYYNVNINVPVGMRVAATGELIENTTKGVRTVLHYDPHLPVREVTFSASRYFIIESYIYPDTNINISTYFLPKSDLLWHNFALTKAINAIDLYYHTFGDYCYSTFNVVEEYTHFGGMEYPLQVYATEAVDYYSGDQEWYLETIIAHETAHQWFYNLLGVDEVDWGYLDEGIVCWVTDWYKDFYHPNWFIFDPYWGLDSVRDYSIDYGLPNKINQSVPECISTGTDYWYIGYTKTNTILEKLRHTIGNYKFIQGLSTFFKEYYFDIADLTDLLNVFELSTGESLEWFFYPWFNNRFLPKYQISNAIYDVSSKLLNFTIYDVNENSHQYSYSQLIPIQIFRQESAIVFESLEWVNGTTHLSIPIENIPSKIRLDYTFPDQFILFQASYHYMTYLETNHITIINLFIPGYNLLFLISFLSLVGLIIVRKHSQVKIKS
jgi:hypothetical protein